MQKYLIYILECADQSYYVGQTDDLEKRLLEHNSQKFHGYTSTRLPVKLVYQIAFPSRTQALTIETKIKKWSRVKKQALINGDFSLSL